VCVCVRAHSMHSRTRMHARATPVHSYGCMHACTPPSPVCSCPGAQLKTHIPAHARLLSSAVAHAHAHSSHRRSSALAGVAVSMLPSRSTHNSVQQHRWVGLPSAPAEPPQPYCLPLIPPHPPAHTYRRPHAPQA